MSAITSVGKSKHTGIHNEGIRLVCVDITGYAVLMVNQCKAVVVSWITHGVSSVLC